VGSGRNGADIINVVQVSCDLSCLMCHGYALECSLEREGEQEGGERVTLLHAGGGED
jgi:hypothetical protein